MIHRLHEVKTRAGETAYLMVDVAPEPRRGELWHVLVRDGPTYLQLPRHLFELVGERCMHDLNGGKIEPRRPTQNPAPPTRL